jgi:putative spermidine/putrescine transport system substrate-binding protein
MKRSFESSASGGSRREFLGIIAGGLAASATTLAGSTASASAATGKLVVADPGGPFTPAFTAAYGKPFQGATGIDVTEVAIEPEPVATVKSMVDLRQYSRDVVAIDTAVARTLGERGLLEPINWNQPGMARNEIMPDQRLPYWMGVSVYATILAYRTDKYGQNGPKTWADFWDVKKFPGRRAMRKSPYDTLEQALLADGVPAHKLYPLDLDRAFRKLDQIKPHITTWWTGGAQATQLLQSGDVDMCPVWNGRAQVAIDSGAPVAIAWDHGIYLTIGLAIPKGDPNAAAAQRFIAFCSDARRMAEWTKTLAYGPTNLHAFKYISAERAKLLPTAPEHLKNLVHSDAAWWAQHQAEAVQRFNTWLLS